MKKLFILIVLAVFLPMSAFAATTDNGNAGSTLTLSTEAPTLQIASSPGVFMYYGDDDTDDPQWYVIGTVHQGGSRYYGTAQNSTSIFQQDASGPIVLTDLTGLTWPATADETASEDWWSGTGWEK